MITSLTSAAPAPAPVVAPIAEPAPSAPLTPHVGISQGGTPSGHLLDPIRAYGHVAWFAAKHILHPTAVRVALKAEKAGRDAEHVLFQGGTQKNGYDNGADAFRHTFATALMASHLVTEAHLDPEQALKFAWDAGTAHELDSHLSGVHNGYSSAMDHHNNAVGVDLGIRHALAGATGGDAALQATVINAIRTGLTVVMDSTTSAPRPSRPADLDLPQHDAPRGQEPTGVPSWTPGFDPHGGGA